MKNQGIVWCAAIISMFAQSCWGSEQTESKIESVLNFNKNVRIEANNGEGEVEYFSIADNDARGEVAMTHMSNNGLMNLLLSLAADENVLVQMLQVKSAALQEAAGRLKDFENKIAENETAIKKLETVLNKSNEETKKIKNENEKLKNQLKEKEKENEELKKEKKKLETEVNQLKSEIETLKNDLNEMKNGVDNLSKEKKKLNEKAESRKAKKEELKKLMEIYDSKYQALLNTVDLLVSNGIELSKQVKNGFDTLLKTLDVKQADLENTKTWKDIISRLSKENVALGTTTNQLQRVSEEATKFKQEIEKAMQEAKREPKSEDERRTQTLANNTNGAQ